MEYRKLIIKTIESVGGKQCTIDLCTAEEFAAFALTEEQIQAIEEEFNILHRGIGCRVFITIYDKTSFCVKH